MKGSLEICFLEESEIKTVPQQPKRLCNNCSGLADPDQNHSDQSTQTEVSKKVVLPSLNIKAAEDAKEYIKTNYQVVILLCAAVLYFFIVIIPYLQTGKFGRSASEPRVDSRSLDKVSVEGALFNQSLEKIFVNTTSMDETVNMTNLENCRKSALVVEENLKNEEKVIKEKKVLEEDRNKNVVKEERNFSNSEKSGKSDKVLDKDGNGEKEKTEGERVCEKIREESRINGKLILLRRQFGENWNNSLIVEDLLISENCEYFVLLTKSDLVKLTLFPYRSFRLNLDSKSKFAVSNDKKYFVYTSLKGSLYVINLYSFTSTRLHHSHNWFTQKSFITISPESTVLYFTRESILEIEAYSLPTLTKLTKFPHFNPITQFKAAPQGYLALQDNENIKIFSLSFASPIIQLNQRSSFTSLNTLVSVFSNFSFTN